jgi:HPt (histidine-containing phosphotransfer) domain-containing protein
MIERLLGDEELAESALAGFLDDLPQQIGTLRGFLEAADAPAASRQAHAIKGAAATVGGERLREVARGMEEAARRGDLPAAAARLAELEAEFTALAGEVRRWMSGKDRHSGKN